MTRILFFLFLAPLISPAQRIKINEYDRFLKQRTIETYPLAILTGGNNSAILTFRSDSTNTFMKLNGRVESTNVIGQNEQVILLFDNDSTATLKSAGLQTYEMRDTYYNYFHTYTVSLDDLIRLRNYKLSAVRQYDSKDFYDVVIPGPSRDKIRQLSGLFIDELKKANIIQAAVASRKPEFPGGERALSDFLARNLRMSPVVNATANKVVGVQLEIMQDGTVTNIRVLQSGGPYFDAEAMRVVKRMPKWKPAISNGRAVPGMIKIDIRFQRGDAAINY